MGVSVFPAAGGGASEALPLGATAKVASAYSPTGGWKYSTSTSAGTYQLAVQATDDQIYGITTANGVQVGNITGGSTVPFKTASTEASITVGSIYPYQKTQFTTAGSTIRTINGGNGLFIMVTNDGYLYTSTDGLSWTNRTSGYEGGASPNVNSVGYVNDRWIIPGWSNGSTNAGVLYSTNGTTWSYLNLDSLSGNTRVNYIGYGGGYWFALFSNGSTTTNLFRSSNFSSWSSITIPQTNNPLAYTYYNYKGTNYHMLACSGGSIFYSTSGDSGSWTNTTAGSTDHNKFLNANGKLLVVGNTGASTSAIGYIYHLQETAGNSLPDTFTSLPLGTGHTIPTTVMQANYILGMYILMFTSTHTLETTFTGERNTIGSNKCLLSKDGFTWTLREMPRNVINTTGQPIDQANGVVCFNASAGQTYYTTAYNSAAFHITSTALTSV
jgi:hypothetical protein